MAEITVKGYVNKPKTVSGSKGDFSVFTLAEQQKDRKGEKFRVFYNVQDFKSAEPPAESAFVTVRGYLNVREYEKDGIKRQSLDISAQNIDVAPPKDGAAKDSADTAKDPWDL